MRDMAFSGHLLHMVSQTVLCLSPQDVEVLSVCLNYPHATTQWYLPLVMSRNLCPSVVQTQLPSPLLAMMSWSILDGER